MALELTNLKKAVTSLEDAISLIQNRNFLKFSQVMQNVLRAGVIQNFEFTYELCWKFMKRYLGNQLGSSAVDGISRTELFRLSAEHHLINDVTKWRSYHDYRNLTSNIYDEDVASEIFEAAKTFIVDAKSFLAELEKRNDYVRTT